MLASLLECSMAICPQQNRLQGDERLHSGEHQAGLGGDHPEHTKHDRLGRRCSGEAGSLHPGHDEVHPVDGGPGGEGPRLDEHLLLLGLPGCPGEDQPRCCKVSTFCCNFLPKTSLFNPLVFKATIATIEQTWLVQRSHYHLIAAAIGAP